MNKTYLILVPLGIAILGVILWVAKPDANKQATAGATFSLDSLEIEEKSYDFGNISMAQGTVSHEFTIKNVGKEPLKLGKMYTSCMCTTVSLLLNGEKKGPFGMPGHTPLPKVNKEIQPGGSAQIEVIFDPAAHGPAGVGIIERVAYVEGSSLAEPLEFGIKAFVTP